MQDATTRSKTASLTAHPRFLAVLPLLYVAWADGALSPEELRQLEESVRALVGDSEHTLLKDWLDPQAPPTSTELMRLFWFIRSHTAHLDLETRRTLVDLGYEIVKREGHSIDDTHLRALREIETAFGLESVETGRHYFFERPAPRQDFPVESSVFSETALNALLDGSNTAEWSLVRQVVGRQTLALSENNTQGVAARDEMTTESKRAQVKAWLDALLNEGWGRLAFPDAASGNETSPRLQFIKVFEALGMHDLSLVVKLGVQLGLFGGAIAALGTERHHATYLARVADGTLLGGFAMTELGHGSNVKDIETVARFDVEKDAFVLHTPSDTARKEWIGNAARDGHALVVFAQLQTLGEEHGVHAFFVPIRDRAHKLLPGVHIEDCGHKMGLNGVDNGRVWFDQVRVPRENLLDAFGSVSEDGTYASPIASSSRRFFTMLGTLVTGRVSIASSAVTAAKVALTTAVRYGALRRQFGSEGQPERSILSYPCHQQRLLPHVAACYVFHFAVEDLQERWQNHTGEDTRAIESLAAGVKALSTWQAIAGAQAAREACGGMGFLSVNRICELRKDLDVFATFEGDNIVLLQLVARSVLGGYAKELSDDFLGTLLGEITRKAKGALRDQNPINKRRTDDEHLLDEAFHRDAFEFREHNLLVSAARRIKRRTDEGLDSFRAATQIQDHLVALATAHIERHVHACFAARIESLAPSPERDALASMRSLWALWRIREDMGWFVENGCFEERKARAIRKRFIASCEDAAQVAVALVNSFGLPDAVLGPIAFENYASVGPLARNAS